MTMIPFTAYPSDIDDGGASWNVQSTSTRPQNTISGRPNISILRQAPDILGSSQALLCSPPRISKREFIERWLQAHSVDAANDISVSQPTLSSSSSSSVIPNSPQSKRVLRSPLKECNQLKRFKKHETTVQSLELTIDSVKSKENHINAVSNINNDADLISEASSSNCTSRSKLDVCRSAIFGVPKRNVKAVTTQPAQSQVNRAIFDGSQSPRIIDIESASSINCESPKKAEIISVASSTPSKVGFQICESESSDDDDRTRPQIGTVDDDSSSDRTASDIIEDPDRNIPEEMNTTLVEGVIDDNFDDADRTFICQDGPMVRQLSNEIVDVLSQHISSVTGSAEDEDNPGCSPPPLKYIAPPIRPVDAPVYFAPKRRRRKRKPGSVTARLIKLVAVKRSDVRIWRHYLSKRVPETSRKEYFSIRISRTICIGGRHCFVGVVARDAYNLLDKLLREENNSSTPGQIVGKTVTAITDSQLIAPKEMEQLDFVRIYPPWQLLDADKFIFKATYFTVHRNENPCDITEAISEENETEILEEFHCPCLNAKRIVHSCPVKFSAQKPTAISCIVKPPTQRRSDSQIFVKED